jgi:hypothetical protein
VTNTPQVIRRPVETLTWPPTANAPTQKPTVYVRTMAQNHVNGGPGNAAVGAPVVRWEKAVSDTFQQSNRFSRVSTDKVDSDLYVDATLYNNEDEAVQRKLF